MLVEKYNLSIISQKKNNSKIIKNSAKKIYGNKYPLNQSMNVNKFTKFIKKK